jgi:DNA repair protein RadC
MSEAKTPGYRSDFKEVPSDERPRERLKAYGPSTLSTSELLAILLSTGFTGKSVTAVAQDMLRDFGGLSGLLRADYTDLKRIKGLGDAKATTIKAAMELGRRLAAIGDIDRPKIGSPEDIFQIVGLEMMALDQEQLRVVLVDTKHQVIATKTVYQGSANQASVRIAELFREAVRHNAVGVILVHNHPSGDPAPSSADVALTAEVIGAGKLLDIDVLDHVVIGHGQYVSMKRLGLAFKRA